MILTWAATLAAFMWLLFLVWYTVRAQWWRVPIGRNVFGVSFLLFLVLSRIALLRWVPGLHESDVSGIIVYGLAAVLGLQRLIYMEKAQRENVSGTTK